MLFKHPPPAQRRSLCLTGFSKGNARCLTQISGIGSQRPCKRRYKVQLGAAEAKQSPASAPAPATEPPATEPPGPPDPGQAKRTAVSKRYWRFLDEWDKGFVDAAEEPEGYYMEVVAGEVPRDLEGTLFRNGPGKFGIGGQSVENPYDADGFVNSTCFKGGRAYFRSRFVRTAEYEAESARGKVLFRGTFATQRAGGPLANALDVYVKNPSNTNVVCWAGRLMSLFEAGQPYALDPRSLATQGLESLGGRLPLGLPFDMGSPGANGVLGALATLHQRRLGTLAGLPQELFQAGGEAVTAHPHVDSNTGRLVGFSYQVTPRLEGGLLPTPPLMATRFHFWEVDRSGEIVASKYHEMPGFAFLHDFVVTEHYYVIFQNPVTVDNLAYLAGTAPAGSCVRWVPGTPTYVHVIPRPGAPPSLAPRTLTAPPCFIFHHANGHEAQGGISLVVDSIVYESLPSVGREALASQGVDPDVAFRSKLCRIELDLNTSTVEVRPHSLSYLEMPAINEAVLGRQHRYVYGYRSDFDNPQIGVAKVDVETGAEEAWMPGFQLFASEPRFVARPGATEEDDGWLLTVVFDSGSDSSYLAILDARDLSAGPVALLRHRTRIPSGLHGCWCPEYYGLPVEQQQ